MYTKIVLKIKTKLLNLSNEELVKKILEKNILVSNLAKEELLNRNLDNLNIDDRILYLLINKLTIEDLWSLKKQNMNNHFTDLVTIKLNKILDYYQNLNFKDFLIKQNEDKKFKLIK